MKLLPALLLLAALSLPLMPRAGAQAPAAAARQSLAQAERNAIGLRQGMSPEDVQKLLGKPRRTALKSGSGLGSGESPQGSLQWTYAWADASSSQGTLQVVFAARAKEEWHVTGWEWANY